jgi:hypothetical protein
VARPVLGGRRLERFYFDRKRNDSRAPLKAVRLATRGLVVGDATIMK